MNRTVLFSHAKDEAMSENNVRIVHLQVSDELCPAGLTVEKDSQLYRHQLGAEPFSCLTCHDYAERLGHLESEPSDDDGLPF